MLVAIVTLFAICWTPSLLDNVLVVFELIDKYHRGPIRYARQAFALMSYANSCINPVVYAFMSKNFRSGFRKTFACNRSCSPSAAQSRVESMRHLRCGTSQPRFGVTSGAGMMTTTLGLTTSVCQQSSRWQLTPGCAQQFADTDVAFLTEIPLECLNSKAVNAGKATNKLAESLSDNVVVVELCNLSTTRGSEWKTVCTDFQSAEWLRNVFVSFSSLS